MSGRQTLMFRQLGREFQRRGWLAKPVTVDSFVTARSYLARLAGSGDGGAVQVYGMLCPAVVDRDAETAAALETSFLAGTSDGEGDGPWAAEALLAEVKPPLESEIQSAIQEIQERAMATRLRELRTLIAEAERRGDFAELAVLTQQKLELDRALRKLHNQRPPEG